VGLPRGKTPERICTHNGSQRVKSGKDVPFGGFVKKWSPPPPLAPNSENFALRKPFSLKTRINLVVIATKIRSQIGNSPWGFKFWVKNLTGTLLAL